MQTQQIHKPRLLQNQISAAPAQAGAQCKAVLCLSYIFLKIINSYKIKYLIISILMTTTCLTTEAALQAGLLPAQERQIFGFAKVSSRLKPWVYQPSLRCFNMQFA
ncbi:MAG: hypothetical protein KAZ00_01225 [Neisseria sp.]|nr:hypothetical protein [Neisseria sp.]